MQLRRSHIRFTKISAVFISHLHGDHCFGLIGMLSTFGLLGRTARLSIYAPKELEDILQRQMKLFCHDFDYEIDFHAVDTSCQKVIYEDRSLTIESIPLEHRMPCCGYLFKEKPLLPHIRRDMVDFYNIPICQINNIKAGADWTTQDGEIVANEQLVIPAEKARSYAYCSDTRYIASLHKRIEGVSTLYHESTYGEDNILLAEKYYHSTARQAAQVASDAMVGKLLLGHYSSRYEDEKVLLLQAKEVFNNVFLTDEQDIFDV